MKNNENETKSKETKICSKCKKEKELSNFYKCKKSKDGYKCFCISCKAEMDKRYRNENIEKFKFSIKKLYIKNKDKILKYANEYNVNHKEQRKKYNKNNRERDKKYLLEYNKENNIILKSKRKEYNKENQNKINIYQNKKYKEDINYKLGSLFRCRIYIALKSGINKSKKYDRSINLLNCNIEFYRQYLESKFLPEMTWENWGSVWEIDHIIPCASFDLTKEEEQQKCFNYKNTIPRFKTTLIAESFGYKDYIGNREKGDKIL